MFGFFVVIGEYKFSELRDSREREKKKKKKNQNI